MKLASPARRSISARVAAKSRWTPEDATIADDRRELEIVRLEEHIREIVAAAPPLTDEQRSKLALLLNPGR